MFKLIKEVSIKDMSYKGYPVKEKYSLIGDKEIRKRNTFIESIKAMYSDCLNMIVLI